MFNSHSLIMDIISKNIRKYRKLNNLTQEQLGEYIGISRDYISRFESTHGREGITLYTLYKISIVLNVTMDEFFK